MQCFKHGGAKHQQERSSPRFSSSYKGGLKLRTTSALNVPQLQRLFCERSGNERYDESHTSILRICAQMDTLLSDGYVSTLSWLSGRRPSQAHTDSAVQGYL